MNKSLGILLPVFSIPSRHGVGDFGEKSYEFVDILASNGVKIWQILPLNPVGYGNSPYQPYSSYAGEEVYISLDEVIKMGLLSEIPNFREYDHQVRYNLVREFKKPYFKQAYEASKTSEDVSVEFNAFKLKHAWSREYAKFITLKKNNDMKSWIEWDDDEKIYDKSNNYGLDEEDLQYEMFIQFLFFKQWHNLKEYANSKGIQIMGDIPIYVGIDSDDVWCDRKSFLLDDDGRPTFVAGVPPDYFSATGQRWGNPIYDWDYLEKNEFAFWMRRMAHANELYDILRIDHFRAFDTYWKIPAECPTAVEGEWIEAPGYAFFDTLYDKYPDVKVVVEDLGDLRPEVLELRDAYQLSGMKILQFELDPNERNNDFDDEPQTIVYTGTHDNQTLLGWVYSQNRKQRKNLRKMYKARRPHDIANNILISSLERIVDLVVLPVQDILILDDAARINMPGTIGSPNWEWKLIELETFKNRMNELEPYVRKAGR